MQGAVVKEGKIVQGRSLRTHRQSNSGLKGVDVSIARQALSQCHVARSQQKEI